MAAIDKLRDMPDWPARMTADVAAAYMGISKTSFLTRFGARGVKEGANTLWARRQLDAIIDDQFALVKPGLGARQDTSWDDFN